MSFRFVHTADWQIGKPFASIGGEAGAELGLQRIKTVQRIAVLAAERQVDAVLVAGDAFDSNEVSDRTIRRTLEALKPFTGLWIFLPGNHDAALAHSVWTRIRAGGPPPNLVIADRPEPLDLWKCRAVVLPAPLRRRRESFDQTEWFDQAATPDGVCRIGLAHGSVSGRLPARAEASNEIDADRAAKARLDYLALGDWHGALRIAPRTWYAGSPEPDRHRANEPGSVNVVSIDGAGAPEAVDTVPVGGFCWIRLEIELFGDCTKLLDALDGLGAEHRTCVLSIRLSGTISLSERHRMEREIRAWEARVHHLEIDDADLVDEPTPDDLDALDTAGFVRIAVERLKLLAADPDSARREAARGALRMIYLDHARRTEA